MNKEQFQEISKWQNKTFPQATVFSKIKHLEQELEELFEALRMHEPGESDQNIRMEFADCFMLLFGAASSAGFSYESCCLLVQEKFEINLSRKWGKPDENGIVNHVKDQDA